MLAAPLANLGTMLIDPSQRATLAAMLVSELPDEPEVFVVDGDDVWRLRAADRSWELLPPVPDKLPRNLRRVGVTTSAAAGAISLWLFVDNAHAWGALVRGEPIPADYEKWEFWALAGSNTLLTAGLLTARAGFQMEQNTNLTAMPTWNNGPGLSLRWSL